jgi:hypothetical protein
LPVPRGHELRAVEEPGAEEIDAREVRIVEDGLEEVGAGEIRADQDGTAENCAAQIRLAKICPGKVGLGEVQAAQGRVREVRPCIRVRRSPLVPGINALLEQREMHVIGHPLFLCREFRRQSGISQRQSRGELGAEQAFRISQIRSRQVGTVEPRHPKVGPPKIGISQRCAVQENAAQSGRPEIGTIQTCLPNAGAAKIHLTQIGVAEVGAVEVHAAHVSAPQTGLSQHSLRHHGKLQVCRHENRSIEVRRLEVGAGHPGGPKIRPRQTSASQVGPDQVCPLQIGACETDVPQNRMVQPYPPEGFT